MKLEKIEFLIRYVSLQDASRGSPLQYLIYKLNALKIS